MIFLNYLTPDTAEIYRLLALKVRIAENSGICRKHDVFGWYNARDKVLTMCTMRIKEYGNTREYINETLLHEAVHVAQHCKAKGPAVVPLHIAPSSMPISARRQQDIQTAMKINGPSVKHIEHEAFWMEDKPDKVRYVLKKFCF